MFLLDALKPVFSKYPEVKLLIMGKAVDEKYASELREKIKEIGAEKNVIFEEPREDVKGILTMLDVFILPSQREGFSRILLEAMACSTPIIASDVSGNNEAITDGETGILVPYEEVSRLSGAVETMLESPGEAEKMGQNARRRVEEFFGIDEHVYKIQKLYYEVIGSAASLTLCRAVKEFLKKLKKYIIWKTGFLTNRPDSKFTLIVPKRFQPLYHSRVDYHGPWIENYFYNFWCGRQKELKESKIDRIYIPIFWTDYYVRHSRWEPNEELQEFINKNIESDKKYFTIVQNADGIIEKIPDNVLVFSAGGAGDVPIPLIKGGLKRGKDVERDIKVSFMGNLAHEVRIRMYEALKDKKGYYFGGGTIKEFIDTAKRSVFTLCPRGYGKTSYRLYEAIALGSIPVYIWDDVEWLPYKDELSWDEFSVSMNIKDIERLPEIIEGHTPEMIKQKQNKLKELYKEYFTMPGVCWQIVRRLEKHP